jgi:hypothetical protein
MKIRFCADITLPDDTPLEDVAAWIEYYLGEKCELPEDNALSDVDLPEIGCEVVSVCRI